MSSGGFTAYVTEDEHRRSMSYLLDFILQRAPANANIGIDVALQAGTRPPQVSGLTLVSRIGQIVVSWNAVPISDIKRYEIRVSTSSEFTDPSTFYSRNLTWTHETGDGDTTYYIKVRARNTSEAIGAWSGTLNADTGLVQTADVTEGAVTTALLALQAATIPSSGYAVGPNQWDHDNEVELVSLEHTSTAQDVFIHCHMIHWCAVAPCIADIALWCDAEVLYVGTFIIYANAPMVTWAFSRSYTPTAGDHTFKITMERTAGANEITVIEASLLVLETKR